MIKQMCMSFSSCLVLFSLLLPGICLARPEASPKFVTLRENAQEPGKEVLILPYAFPSDSLGTTFGLGMMTKGYGQKQLLTGVTVFGSTDDAVGGIGGIWDYQLPGTDRFFFSIVGSLGDYPRQRAYTQVVRTGNDKDAGGNDSGENDYIEDEGTDNWFEMKLEYVLPIGSMRHKSMGEYHLKDGILESGATGGDVWNPLESGTTVLMLKQSNRYQTYETPSGELEGTIHPLKLGLLYNNTDFYTNPSKGSSQYIGITHDNGWLDSKEDWTFIEFEASKYFGFGKSNLARQRVLALNFWTGDCPTYDKTDDGSGGTVVKNNAPFVEGARLGGLYRMRAYPNNRFNDRSVVYTSAEYRYTPKWNPVANISWLKFLKMDWFQVVGFVEGGRVASSYSFSELTSSWKFDAGLGLRAMMAGGIVRFDVAAGDEGATGWVMFAQPF